MRPSPAPSGRSSPFRLLIVLCVFPLHRRSSQRRSFGTVSCSPSERCSGLGPIQIDPHRRSNRPSNEPRRGPCAACDVPAASPRDAGTNAHAWNPSEARLHLRTHPSSLRASRRSPTELVRREGPTRIGVPVLLHLHAAGGSFHETCRHGETTHGIRTKRKKKST